jgi:hypothetical protein
LGCLDWRLSYRLTEGSKGTMALLVEAINVKETFSVLLLTF